MFLMGNDFEIWKIITTGVTIPTTSESKWNEDQIKKCQLNAKALNALFCALSPGEFDRVSSCTTAKEVWEKLEVTHEGTSQVKESKINMLMHEYEMFTMSTSESIADMFARFSKVVNSLKGFGKDVPMIEQVKKILRSLPKNWTAKVTAIEEAKDLNVLTVDQLIGSLMTHEITLKKNDEADYKGKKSIALKANNSCDFSEDTSNEDDEVAMLTRRIRRFITRNKHDNQPKRRFRKTDRKTNFQKGEPSKSDEIKCYKCNGIGHMQNACPSINKVAKDKYKKRDKESFGAWCDSDSSLSISS